MPPQQRKRPRVQESAPARTERPTCTALNSSGVRCGRYAVPGLTVCKTHGGNTAASARAGKRASVSQQTATLWGISEGAGSISVEAELTKLARNKLTDILALRIELGLNTRKHIGLLTASHEVTEAEVAEDVFTTVKRKRVSGVSPWVKELHEAEKELIAILRLLQEVTGGTEEIDLKRIRMQTARETARLMKAFPGIGVDEVAAEVSKRAS